MKDNKCLCFVIYFYFIPTQQLLLNLAEFLKKDYNVCEKEAMKE